MQTDNLSIALVHFGDSASSAHQQDSHGEFKFQTAYETCLAL